MYKELVFTTASPTAEDGYAGGGAYLPAHMPWPSSADGTPLVHLLALPARWLGAHEAARWISVFIPYTPGDVGHYRSLRLKDGGSQAVVLSYLRQPDLRDEAPGKIIGCGRVAILLADDEDDDENLASKLEGVDAWLQAPLRLANARRRVSIYGAELDNALPGNKGVLSDGMGYLLLSDGFIAGEADEAAGFFLQLG
ncbi:hypothetical protein [Pseudomonas sp. NPDC089401]|uniref:hypothetical protein n=1 Tax=Pseudomonas sp. NPDC089401 TaxID=3364462 RepID=UPI0037F58165